MVRSRAVLNSLAIFFLVAPLGNLFFSAALSGVERWWTPTVFGELLKQVSPFDWSWLVLIFVSGVLLLIRHKTAWLVAVLTTLLVIALNVTSVLDGEATDMLNAAKEVQIFFSVFLSFCVLIVLFYARYPYIDRRQGWWRPAADRYEVQTPVHITAGSLMEAETESLSATGCRVRLRKLWSANERLRFVDLRFPDFGSTQIKAQVVGVDGLVVRLKFREFHDGQAKAFQKWVDGLGQKPV